MDKKLTKFGEFTNKVGEKAKTTLKKVSAIGKNAATKIGTVASAFLVLSMLNNPAYAKENPEDMIRKLTPDRTVEQVKDNVSKVPGHQMISFGHEVQNYKNAIAQYKPDEKFLFDVLTFNACNLTREETENKLVDYITTINKNTLDLALVYEALEFHNLSKAGNNFSEHTRIARNGGSNNPEVDKLIEFGSTQNTIVLSLNSLIMENFGAHKAQMLTIDRTDGNNEVIRKIIEMKKNGIRDLVADSNAILDYLIDTIITKAKIEYKNTGKDLKQVDQIKTNLTAIKKICQEEINENNKKTLNNLINSTAQLLQGNNQTLGMFGDAKMCNGLIRTIADQYGLNKKLTETKFKSINPNKLANKSKLIYNPFVTANFTNSHAGFGLGMDLASQKSPVSGGIKYNLGFGKDGESQSHQILGNVNYNGDINNIVDWSAGGIVGLQFDKNNDNTKVSTPLGLQVGLEKDFGTVSTKLTFQYLGNIQNKSNEIGIGLNASFHLDDIVITVGTYFGHEFITEQQITPTPQPGKDKPVISEPVISDDDEIQKPGPGGTTDTGSIDEKPELPGSLWNFNLKERG